MTKDISLRRLVAGSLLAGAAVFAPLAAQAQAAYPDPESAAEDFVRAVDSGDDASKTRVLGPGWPSVIPPGAVDDADRDAFLRMARERLNVSAVRAGVAEITVGAIETWTLPIPLKADAQGRWFFDLDGAREQIRERIIGRNELATIQAMLAFVDAQREYALADRNRDGVLEYAQRLVSSPGRQDGLIWDERRFGPSPLGPDFLPSKPGAGYHGYRFKLLTSQGPTAPGKARDYKIGGRLLTGFALLGWPVEWGETGVMSFMVDHTGRIVQRDLGPQTALIVQQILRYEPDAGWEQVVPASP
ncbi:MAG: DUF2950 domain-containing protein [Rubrivivax sp.]|jgi:hypothetical protein|nr:DUF2950 domain-containing protein [Rubrivivax sp.]